MKACAFIIVCVLMSGISYAGEAEKEKAAEMEGFIQGSYILLGRRADGSAYTGRVVLSLNGKRTAHRVISGKKTEGSWEVSGIGYEDILVLKVRFTENKIQYTAVYLIDSDMDNYPRLTGEVYREKDTGKSTGLEALFSDHE